MLAVTIGYFAGSLPFAFLLTRRQGVDLRDVGSGNVGAANVLRTSGWPPAVAAMCLDGAKGAAYKPQGDSQTIPFTRTFASIAEEIAGVLAKFEEENGAQFSLRHTEVDPAQTSIVAYLRNDATGEVLQAAQVDPKQPAAPAGQGK